MTNEQQPGGVAGRVLRGFSDPEEYGTGTIGYFIIKHRYNGASRMHDELSREARVILAELEIDKDQAHYHEELDGIHAADSEYYTLTAAFIRLGLNLESEES